MASPKTGGLKTPETGKWYWLCKLDALPQCRLEATKSMYVIATQRRPAELSQEQTAQGGGILMDPSTVGLITQTWLIAVDIPEQVP